VFGRLFPLDTNLNYDCNFVALVMKFRFTVVEKKKTLPILNATLSEALK
jgi:hypothetical protein